MPDPYDVSPTELAELLAVLNHPEHQESIGTRVITINETEHTAEHLVRLSATVSGSDSLAGWDDPNPTVRLSIPEAPDELSAFDYAPLTTSRVYTLAEVEIATRTVKIDFVVHAEPSPAMRWLKSLTVGDVVEIVGPRPHRVPGDGKPRILLADSSALPAAMRILKHTPVVDKTLLIAAVPQDEFVRAEKQLASRDRTLDLRRIEPTGVTALTDAFNELKLPDSVSVWASGERDDVRQIRHRCKHQLGLPPERIQVFGYWKRGVTNTRLDFARLRATNRILSNGGGFFDLDDFDIEL